MTAHVAGARHEAGFEGPSLLEVSDLSIRFATGDGWVYAVTDISFQVQQGEVFALVGESGSGKSVTALSVMGLLPSPPAEVTGSISLAGRELTSLSSKAMRSVRGPEVGMVFQDPMSSMNPVHPVGRQIGEGLRLHFDLDRRTAKKQAIDLLERVGIPDPAKRADDYPHEFSGGMRQRAMIAMALSCDPNLLIADEPTTALDVTVQSQIVELVRELQRERHMAVIWITHDLGVVAEIADRVAVMYGGRIMEHGTAREVYGEASHPYTAGLLRSIPRIGRRTDTRLAEIPGTPETITEPLAGCAFHHRCPLAKERCLDGLPEPLPTGRTGHATACVRIDEIDSLDTVWIDEEAESESFELRTDEPVITIEDLTVHFPIRRRADRRHGNVVRAVDGVDLVLRRGHTLGVVGESGCGKTTLGRTLVGLIEPTSGTIEINDQTGAGRRVVQMVFQDPFSSMNPGMRVADIIAEPLRVHPIIPSSKIDDRVVELLEMVGLPADAARRHPHEFSGGQRQRIAVARALAAEPEVIVCDEPVSALDVSVQAQIVNLLQHLQRTQGLSFLFIAHDLAVVRHISDEVAVMYLGQIVERASRDDLYREPLHPYTRALLESVPVPDPTTQRVNAPLRGDLPSPSNPPTGCRFHTRCPVAEDRCSRVVPELRELAGDRWVACHLVTDQPQTEIPT